LSEGEPIAYSGAFGNLAGNCVTGISFQSAYFCACFLCLFAFSIFRGVWDHVFHHSQDYLL